MNFHNVMYHTSYGTSKQIPNSEQLEFVFAGRSNVGKSSLINKIFNRKNLARVSGVPGKTATINLYRLEDIDFVDLPGYGYAKVSKGEKRRWSDLIEGYFQKTEERNLVLVFLLLDMRHPPSKDDKQMVDYLIEIGLPFVVILTKCDKLNKTQYNERLTGFQKELECGDQIHFFPVSSIKGTGIVEVRALIEELSEDYRLSMQKEQEEQENHAQEIEE